MMIKINLLADKDKEERKFEEKLGIILRTSISAVFALSLLAITMFSIEFILNIEFKSAQKESQAQSGVQLKDIEVEEELLKETNALSQKVVGTAQGVPRWSKVFGRLSNDCPTEIRITGIYIEKEHIKITGFSKSRDAFLEFQKSLDEEEFTNLVSPISNLVSPQNFNFTVEVDVDKTYLNEP